MTFSKLNFHISPPPAYFRTLCQYSRANSIQIRRAISQFNWELYLATQTRSWQVSFFNKTFLNIMSNFIPNEYLKVQPKGHPWISKILRRLLKKQNRHRKEVRKDNVREECFKATKNVKNQYLIFCQ